MAVRQWLVGGYDAHGLAIRLLRQSTLYTQVYIIFFIFA